MNRKFNWLLVIVILLVLSGSYLPGLCAQEGVFGVAELKAARLSVVIAEGSLEQTTVDVAVFGKVEYPGVYQVNVSSGVIGALLTAGGICKDGSLRNVEHWRNHEHLASYDLYEFIKSGINAKFSPIEDHDRIFVPEVGTLISIQGAISQPGLYEIISESISPAEVVCLAGGLLSPNHPAMVKFLFTGRATGMASELALAHMINEPVIVRDKVAITVVSSEEQSALVVSIEGAINKKITWNAALSIRSVIREYADLFGHNIYCAYAEILRQSGVDKTYQVLSFSPDLILRGDDTVELMLRPGDRIMLFPVDLFLKSAKVSAEGKISVPGAYAFKCGMRVTDLLQLSGGIDGVCTRIYLVRRQIQNANLNTMEVELTSDYLAENSRFNMLLQPFDTLVVE